MKRRVAIIGTGWVGSSVAISTLHSGVVDELLLYDVREAVAEGEAIGLVTADLLRCILRNERRVLTVSRVQTGAFGLSDVALSLPTVVGAQGAVEVLEPEISVDERQRLEHSADVLRRAAVGLA
jgi:malate/lactate dehydrogenase